MPRHCSRQSKSSVSLGTGAGRCGCSATTPASLPRRTSGPRSSRRSGNRVILSCSLRREAAASKWVNKEVTYWLEHNSIDTLLIGLTDGEVAWDESAGDFSAWGDRPPPLPPALAKRFPSEPKWVDLRPYREGADRTADKRDAKFTELAADFAAAIRGMPKEDLLSQEVRQQRRALALAWSAAGALLVLALAAATAGVLAYHEEREAVAQRTRAEQTLAAATQTANSLVSDLAQRFRDTVGVPASLVKDILDRARALQQQLIKSGQATPDLLLSEANALAETSLTLLTIGDTAGALSAANQDRHILADLLATNPGNTGWQQDLSIAYQRIGSAQTARGDLPGALKSYGESRTILDRLIRSNSDKADWQQDLATLDELIADARKAQGDFAVALQAVRDGIAIMERLVQAAPANTTWQYDLSLEYGRLGDIQTEQSNFADALKSYQQTSAVLDRLSKSDASNALWQRNLAMAYSRTGNLQLTQGDLAGALKSYRDSLAILDQLSKSDPGNAGWQRDIAIGYGKVGNVQKLQKDLAGALASYRDCVAIFDMLAKADPSNTDWQLYQSAYYGGIGNLLVAQGDLRTGALQSYRNALDIAQKLAQSDSSNADWQFNFAVSYMNVGDVQERQNELAGALKSYHAAAPSWGLTQSQPNNPTWQRALAAVMRARPWPISCPERPTTHWARCALARRLWTGWRSLRRTIPNGRSMSLGSTKRSRR